MKHPRRFLQLAASVAAITLGTALTLALTGSGAISQPARTIKIVVPFPPGGGIDAVARVMADQVGRAQGPVVVVENRPGAGTIIGTEAVFRSKPDGNTLLIGNNSFLVAPHMHKTPYDPIAGFEPICITATTPTVIVVNANSPYRTLDDLVRAARAKPGELTYASVNGAVLSVGFEMLNRAAGVKMTFVPFTGTAPALNAVLGGHVAATLVDYPVAAGQLQGGTLRALATGSRSRIEWLPDVPTVAEFRLQGFRAGALVRAARARADAEGHDRATRRPVHRVGASARHPLQAFGAGHQGRRPVRRRLRRAAAQGQR